MFSRRFSTSIRSLVYFAMVLALTVTILVLINKNVDSGIASAQTDEGNVVSAPAAPIPGTGVGEIPDGGPGALPDFGPPLVISFPVSGVTGSLTSVRVDITLTHSWDGDVDLVLAAPGGSPSMTVVSRIGVTSAGSFGDSTNYDGTYNFVDSAGSAAIDNIWSKSLGTNGNPACGDTCNVPSGNYRTTAPGQTGQTNPAPVTNLTAAFSGLTPAQINGTWTLSARDAAEQDTGAVSAANLELTSTSAPIPDSLGDFDGDGKTDFAVIRTAPGINGQATWHINMNQNFAQSSRDWGFASDTFLANDFDGDGKDDIAVWRPGVQSSFFIIQSQTNTFRFEDWGLASDNASVVGDYDNDGRDDFAVYRPGATGGAQSFWYWKSSVPGTTINVVPWGLGGDNPAPGDYDGDGRMDFAVQRASSGSGVFYRRYSSGIADTVTTLGNATDFVVPGDYDGDSKTDLCVVGPSATLWQWTFRPSGGGPDVIDTWGVTATDDPAPGDYNGDGKADYAVWRVGALSTFWVMRPVTRQIDSRQWGLIDDVAVTFTYAQ